MELDISGAGDHVEIRAKSKALDAFRGYLASTESYLAAVEALEPENE